MKSRHSLAARAFLYASIPMCLLLAAGFLAIHLAVKNEVKEGLKESLQLTEKVRSRIVADYRERNSQLLALLTENAGLKAAMGLLRETQNDPQEQALVRETIEAQFLELGKSAEYDLLLSADPSGQPLTGLVRTDTGIVSLATNFAIPSASPLVRIHGELYETMTLPVNLGDENLGSLTVGKKFDLTSWNYYGYAALLEGSKIILTNLPREKADSVESSLRTPCAQNQDGCEIDIAGETYLALPVEGTDLGDNYRLFNIQSLDDPMGNFTRGFRRIFLLVTAGGVMIALLLSALISRSVSKPLTNLITRLAESERTGSLRSDFPADSTVQEVNLLAQSLNRAGEATQESRKRLDEATLEFVESMAQALDARDAYTAGHSNRVSANSTAIAQAMSLPDGEIEKIRIGALLHDIGKIGVPDTILQKPGPLTPAEFALVKLHPQIGKRILEKVGRFQEYLPIVELHHEDFDGGGYPYGLKREEIPLGVRIVHVADVYDAITSNRTYRKAMPETQVLEIIEHGSGRQFDPEVVTVFLSLQRQRQVLEEVLEEITRTQEGVQPCLEVGSLPVS